MMSLWFIRFIVTKPTLLNIWEALWHVSLATQNVWFKNSDVTSFPWCLAKPNWTLGKRKYLYFTSSVFKSKTHKTRHFNWNWHKLTEKIQRHVKESVYRGTVGANRSEDCEQTMLLILLARQIAYRRSASRASVSFSIALYTGWLNFWFLTRFMVRITDQW